MKIVIPGGSGQIGTILARHFHQQGHIVTVLSRDPKPAPWQVIRWDAQTDGPWTAALEQSDICINLTGRSVNCRYHPENRRQMYDSRIVSTRLLNDVIASLKHPPRLWLNASTATIYRHALDRPMEEMTGELGGNEPGARLWRRCSQHEQPSRCNHRGSEGIVAGVNQMNGHRQISSC
jgi:hypothetical protein